MPIAAVTVAAPMPPMAAPVSAVVSIMMAAAVVTTAMVTTTVMTTTVMTAAVMTVAVMTAAVMTTAMMATTVMTPTAVAAMVADEFNVNGDRAVKGPSVLEVFWQAFGSLFGALRQKKVSVPSRRRLPPALRRSARRTAPRLGLAGEPLTA